MGIPFDDRIGLAPSIRTEIVDAISEHNTLHRMLQWAAQSSPAREVVQVVVQDEYTHDVVIPWADGAFLVYDCT